MGTRMIATALLAALATLVLTLTIGFLLSVLFRNRGAGKRLQMGISVSVLQTWLIGLYLVMLVVIWKLIGKEG